MRNRWIMASAAALALGACGGGGGSANEAAADNLAADNLAMAEGAAGEAGGNAVEGDPAAPTATSAQEYATMAGASDLFEIQSSQLALEKTQSTQVREFAQMLVTDHQRSTTELQAAAGQAQPPITVTPALNPEQQANMERLRAASGAEFDRLYLEQQVPAHEKALRLVTHYAQNGDSEPFRNHASTVSGPIRQHLERARTLAQSGGQ